MSAAPSRLVCAPVPAEMVDRFWADAARHMQRAEKTANGRMTVDDLYRSVKAGRHMMWIVFDTDENRTIAAFTTRVEHYPQMRAMVIEWMGGARMSEWLGLAHDHIKAHAKLNECSRLEAVGRNAWIRWAQRVGWEPEYVQYTMEV